MNFPSFDPIELHRRNAARLTARDVIIPGYPGSGASLIGNILLELGLYYLDPYTEVVGSEGRAEPVEARRQYRMRLAAADRRDRCSQEQPRGPSSFRFVKTHLYPDEFPNEVLARVVLLVRHPFDAIHSYYCWRVGFSEEGETSSFEEFLAKPGFMNRVPGHDWGCFNLAWTDVSSRCGGGQPLYFEALKKEPVPTVIRFLATVGLEFSTLAVERAIEASSFDSMRRHEDGVCSDGADKNPHRIMRRGEVDEWRRWLRPEHAGTLSDPVLRESAHRLGYNIPSV